jgi:SAM-dependent methyltransferase
VRLSSCPLCDAEEREEYARDEDLVFCRCGSCGLIYRTTLIGLEREAYQREDYFSRLGYDRKRAHRIAKASWQIAILEERGGRSLRPGRLLDVGCGCAYGYTLEAARARGWEAEGLEPSRHCRQRCTELGFAVMDGELTRIPAAGERYGAVILKHVFEHTWEPRKALAEIRRVLEPDGLVFFDLPNAEYHKAALLRSRYMFYQKERDGMHHYVYYTPATLAALLKGAGFEIAGTWCPLLFRHEAARRPRLWWRELVFPLGRALRHRLMPALRLRKEFYLVASKPTDGAP